MKKRFFALCITLFLFLPLIRLPVLAAGYVASKNSDVYHKESCFYVDRIKSSNKVFYDSPEEAENAGKRGCSRCHPSLGTKSTTPNSVTSKASNNLAGNTSNNSYTTDELQEAYDQGYEWGYEKGYEKGKSDTIEQDVTPQISKAKKETFWGTVAVIYLFINPLISVFTDGIDWSKLKRK